MIGVKPLRISFDKVDGFIKVSNGPRHLVLFGHKKYDAICSSIRYLIGLKSGITYNFSHYCVKVKVDSYDSLHLEKTLTLRNVIIYINSALNKYQNLYYNNISRFFKKYSYQLAEK